MASNDGEQAAASTGSTRTTTEPTTTPKKYRHNPKDFDFESTLGDGAFSKVVVGRVINEESPHHGASFAVKIMDKRHIVKNDKIKYVNIEKQVFVATKPHPFVCHMHFSFQDSYSLYFALDLCSDETLAYLIYKYVRLPLDLTKTYMSELVSVLDFMHSRGIYHRDVKPENVLIHSDGHIRVTDFGTCKIMTSKSDKKSDESKASQSAQSAQSAQNEQQIKKNRKQSFVGTALYVPPEMLESSSNFTDDSDGNEMKTNTGNGGTAADAADAEEKDYYAGMDFWALGCIIYQCLLGKAPFEADNEYLIFKRIEKLNYELPEQDPNLSPAARDVIKSLLNPKLTQRLGVGAAGLDTLKSHPFFESVESWEWSDMQSKPVPSLPKTPENSPARADAAAPPQEDGLLAGLGMGAADVQQRNDAVAQDQQSKVSQATSEYYLLGDQGNPTKQGNDCCCLVM